MAITSSSRLFNISKMGLPCRFLFRVGAFAFGGFLALFAFFIDSIL